jgi:2-dehydropantoate 2-reductase
VRVAIIGAGAIGCAYGYRLTVGGHNVALIDTWAEHVAAIAGHGLIVVEPNGERRVAISAGTDIDAASDAEVALIAVKSFDGESAARTLAPVRRPDAIVVTLQNGIGNDARLAAVLGTESVVQGSTTVGAEVLGPGRVWVSPGTVRGESTTVLGRPATPPAAAMCESLARALNESGLPATVLDDVRAIVWRKAVLAAAIGPLCATLHGTVADVLHRPPALALLRRAFAEIVTVADAEGFALDGDEVWTQALQIYRSIGPHPPSLAVDVARGRATEIDSQLGEIRRRGAAAGIATPVSDVLMTIVQAMRVPGPGPGHA